MAGEIPCGGFSEFPLNGTVAMKTYFDEEKLQTTEYNSTEFDSKTFLKL